MNSPTYILYRCRSYDQMVLGVYSSFANAAADANRCISKWGSNNIFQGQEFTKAGSPVIWLKRQSGGYDPDAMYFMIYKTEIDKKVSL